MESICAQVDHRGKIDQKIELSSQAAQLDETCASQDARLQRTSCGSELRRKITKRWETKYSDTKLVPHWFKDQPDHLGAQFSHVRLASTARLLGDKLEKRVHRLHKQAGATSIVQHRRAHKHEHGATSR